MPAAPHFSFPLRASGSTFAQVEQDSTEEIHDCVEASLRTFEGTRVEAPEYGIPDATFEQLGPDVTADSYLLAVAKDEPRARLLGEAETEELTKRVKIESEPPSA